MHMDRCETCIFYDPLHERSPVGYCRVKPPVYDVKTGSGVWPEVSENDWCGIYQMKTESKGFIPRPVR